MKTIKEWLETLPEPYREQALKNAKPFKYALKALVPDLASAIRCSFLWSHSPEGFDYWFDFNQKLK